MTRLDKIIEAYPDMEFISADGFDDALIGVSDEKLVYSRAKCIEVLINRYGMTYKEASKYFDFNVESAYMGDKTPIWVDDEMFNIMSNE